LEYWGRVLDGKKVGGWKLVRDGEIGEKKNESYFVGEK